MKLSRFVICFLGFALAGGSASASVLFAFDESGGDVVGTLSGSLDLTGTTPGTYSPLSSNEVWPLNAIIESGVASGSTLDSYTVIGPAGFGLNQNTLASASTGSAFFLSPRFDFLGLPRG